MYISIILVLGAALLASGILFKHQRALTLLATAGIIFEAQWLALTYIDRVLLVSVSSSLVFLIGSIVMLVGWGIYYQRWTWPYMNGWGSSRRDLIVILTLVPVVAAVLLVQSVNGFDGNDFVMHGFYNGDTVTLGSLVERSRLVEGLPAVNPFAADVPLEYSTLLHAGIATMLAMLGVGSGLLFMLPTMTLVQVVLTVPLFFLLWDVMWPEPQRASEKWLGVPSRWALLLGQGALAGYVMTLSWDGFIYPQTHFFMTGMFLLLAALLWHKLLWPAVVVTFVLMVANAVTGTAAVAIMLVYLATVIIQPGAGKSRRVRYLIGAMLWVVLFLLLTPGNASFGVPSFSYTAAQSFAPVLPALIALIVAVFLSRPQDRWLVLSVSLLVGMSFFTYFFSDRGIVKENAMRFVYHALLIGFPLLLSPIVRLYYWLKRELLQVTLSVDQLIARAVLVVSLILVFLLPAGIGVVTAHDHLMFNDRQVISFPMRLALAMLKDVAGPNDVVLVSTEEPWAVPFLTGRPMIRTFDYWLSPQDDLLWRLRAAFDGDKEAQAEMLARADFLLLTDDELKLWEPLEYERLQKFNHISLYRIR